MHQWTLFLLLTTSQSASTLNSLSSIGKFLIVYLNMHHCVLSFHIQVAPICVLAWLFSQVMEKKFCAPITHCTVQYSTIILAVHHTQCFERGSSLKCGLKSFESSSAAIFLRRRGRRKFLSVTHSQLNYNVRYSLYLYAEKCIVTAVLLKIIKVSVILPYLYFQRNLN
jgi:hypothetical protein